ncbi:PREDICTED: uncharacterized protein LOC108767974 [Trachymyrmex cornetzi]|uniref:uncharacterized protein LOC108767974 n=1 Tax=Trachymyrmex cornetzi TaxID=471704 RepID=UPI00084F4BFC|nr:PREDICTED: uncharacterized protein LOC108767974 [Trachymyrmex cornetzi]
MVNEVRGRTRRHLYSAWEVWLSHQGHGGSGVAGAIAPIIERWSEAGVSLSFRATQMLTGHGCFGRYLCRIGRENSPKCWHCAAQHDTARHTVRYCPAWNDLRADLVRAIGPDLTMPGLLRSLLNKEGREAFTTFSEAVMSKKEAHERAREGVPSRVAPQGS